MASTVAESSGIEPSGVSASSSCGAVILYLTPFVPTGSVSSVYVLNVEEIGDVDKC